MFRNRGEVPNINIGLNDNDNGANDAKTGYNAPHYSHYWNGRFFIINYDKTFVAIELVSYVIIILTIFAVYLFAYNISFEDPIASIKSNFLRAQLITIVSSIIITILVTFLTRKSKENLIRNLIIMAFAYIVINLVFCAVKLNMNNKYNEETFQEFYVQYEEPKASKDDSNEVVIDLSGVKYISHEQAYIEKSVNAYTNFSVKTTLYNVIYFLVVVVIFYLAYRISTIERKRQRLEKDDIVVYDDEQNIKY